jgi:hypothetical protein
MNRGWENITHSFMELDVKEKAKEYFGFSSVPFIVAVSNNGVVVEKGSPKVVTVEFLETSFLSGKAAAEEKEQSPAVGASNETAIDVSLSNVSLNDKKQETTPEFTLDEDF